MASFFTMGSIYIVYPTQKYIDQPNFSNVFGAVNQIEWPGHEWS